MVSTFKVFAAAGLLAATASIAGAAPISVGPAADGARTGIIQVHGDHRSCQRGRHGWHRHNRWGERRHCRKWHGSGRRPDHCVRIGPIYYCDY
jgi:hypothetical protein